MKTAQRQADADGHVSDRDNYYFTFNLRLDHMNTAHFASRPQCQSVAHGDCPLRQLLDYKRDRIAYAAGCLQDITSSVESVSKLLAMESLL